MCKKRNGNFVAKKDIDFKDSHICEIHRLENGIRETIGCKADISFVDNERSGFDGSSYRIVTTEITVKLHQDQKAAGHFQKSCDGTKRKLTSAEPVVHILIHNQEGIDEVTGEFGVQPCCYIATHGLSERGYRKHKWECFSVKPSFGFGYEISTLWQDAIKPALENVKESYGLLLER